MSPTNENVEIAQEFWQHNIPTARALADAMCKLIPLSVDPALVPQLSKMFSRLQHLSFIHGAVAILEALEQNERLRAPQGKCGMCSGIGTMPDTESLSFNRIPCPTCQRAPQGKQNE